MFFAPFSVRLPPQGISTERYAQEDARQYVDTLELKPVTRKDSGTYLCQAENSIGLSNEEPAEIDVQCECNTSSDRDKAGLRNDHGTKIKDNIFCTTMSLTRLPLHFNCVQDQS